jgi:hypothetical protein
MFLNISSYFERPETFKLGFFKSLFPNICEKNLHFSVAELQYSLLILLSFVFSRVYTEQSVAKTLVSLCKDDRSGSVNLEANKEKKKKTGGR